MAAPGGGPGIPIIVNQILQNVFQLSRGKSCLPCRSGPRITGWWLYALGRMWDNGRIASQSLKWLYPLSFTTFYVSGTVLYGSDKDKSLTSVGLYPMSLNYRN